MQEPQPHKRPEGIIPGMVREREMTVHLAGTGASGDKRVEYTGRDYRKRQVSVFRSRHMQSQRKSKCKIRVLLGLVCKWGPETVAVALETIVGK